ncbi:MAG: hypothetical protein DCC56_02150 [Anaerolineae bacterium]|nr:MAG: hypothetical protein DCC56_02150 [Anaerolineae bacterium]WKZ44839.1 MAG: hypothetical protein QY302_03485 [Anaerolineales bacterium]
MKTPKQEDFDKELDRLRKTIPRVHWGRLRFIGNVRNLSVSIMIGLALALPDLIGTDLVKYLKNPQLINSLLVFITANGLAYLFYEIFCPPIIKKFESLADFYEHQLNIKKLQLETYPKDPFEANLQHVAKHYIRNLGQYNIARWITLILYIVGFGALIYLLGHFYDLI